MVGSGGPQPHAGGARCRTRSCYCGPVADTVSQMRAARGTGSHRVLNRTVKVVDGVPRAGVRPSASAPEHRGLARAPAAAADTQRRRENIAITSRLMTRASIGPPPGRSRYI